MTDRSPKPDRNHRFEGFWQVSTFLIPLIAVLGVSVVWILSIERTEVQDRIGSSLTTVLNAVHKAIEIWADQTEIDVSVLAESTTLLPLVARQSRAARSSLKTRELEQIRQVLAPAIQKHRYLGFFIIAPDGITIAAQTDAELGNNEIKTTEPLLIATALAGNTALGLPFESPVNSGKKGVSREVIDVAAPIREGDAGVSAILILRVDTSSDFTETTELGRVDKTGETFVFARSGRLLSESRFNEQLKKALLLPSGDIQSALSVELRDPGGNTVEGFRPTSPRHAQPLTKMVQSAITGRAGMDLQGYRDYRGVLVVGSWLWDEKLGMGFATEMDVREAFHPYDVNRRMIFLLLVIVTGIGIFLQLVLQHRSRLMAANRGFRESVRAREDLMAIVAHDLRNPLNSIILRSKIASDKLPPCSNQDFVKDSLGRIHQTAYHMNVLVGDLNLAAQFEAGHLALELQPCQLKEAIEPVLDRLRLLAREKEISFTTEYEAVASEILSADTTRLSQIVSNLIGNAIKFTPKGGAVRFTAQNQETDICFTIEDSGPGIDPGTLPHVFEKFWQARTTRSGMGLGLFITKLLVDAHHGRIWINSSLGIGTTIHFTIPKSLTMTAGI